MKIDPFFRKIHVVGESSFECTVEVVSTGIVLYWTVTGSSAIAQEMTSIDGQIIRLVLSLRPKGRLHLLSLLNYAFTVASRFAKLLPEERTFLKGLGLRSLCHALKVAMFYFDLTANTTVTLGASGTISNKNDMMGLIRLYESLGFQVINPKNTKSQILKDEEVPMSSNLALLLKNCQERNQTRKR